MTGAVNSPDFVVPGLKKGRDDIVKNNEKRREAESQPSAYIHTAKRDKTKEEVRNQN